MKNNECFLLIKAWGSGFWSDVSHVAGQLLIAELTNRIPIIFWGVDSGYASEKPIIKDAFSMYFLPVSNYSVNDLKNKNYTFFPSKWNQGNLHRGDLKDLSDLTENSIGNVFRSCENVIVSNIHIYVNYLIQWINKSHPLYGLDIEDIYKYLYQKHLTLQPYLFNEIEDFYSKNMKNKHPILGVHIRGSDKIHECPNLQEINNSYQQKIDSYLLDNPHSSILNRTPFDHVSVHNGGVHYDNTKQKGIEIIKDTYLAMKCDHFIGNHSSNVSVAISRLKSWAPKTITLL
ncbi:O-fucosyltransferase family protein [Peribacillus frigoritolerans]|uniref:O-fucosyltransferase family protein n=1 Tax=Peribacillus frigoritolerans TaxID=450367 RepID=UPI002B24A1C4|nr:O-fucosyltransferase family protein [Peribacillus frigoritolerans]MEB2628198.1 O-fucosyltransferase family protein [Peribacillus frigoritolerans]